MSVNNIMDSVVSITLGVLLAMVIFTCILRPHVIRGPNSRDIVDKIFEVDGKYYEFFTIVCGCLKK